MMMASWAPQLSPNAPFFAMPVIACTLPTEGGAAVQPAAWTIVELQGKLAIKSSADLANVKAGEILQRSVSAATRARARQSLVAAVAETSDAPFHLPPRRTASPFLR